ncbi:sucrose-6-phosphate hydrolase [Anaeromassilibacillus sp. An172]|uniref:sucrose-6-phosphate hydrolase n=1 Tax=Anaeromassilibacillus sp. An172 TaxID=1965570 RepID=UPI000B390D85|nr:sucrose-6-phosphate hydrolase [Anaeromassilibacillus sp. An172]OUP76824.1 sucrose-6-phosphate hydrolase [Anaeromassilibacillus sp. An172]
MSGSEIYLDTYVLQQDMRIRMPKSVLSNLNIEKGKTKFDIYLDSECKALVLRIHEECEEN